ncbi:hypothetical protein KR093_006833, partial [Drosophila rubida]
ATDSGSSSSSSASSTLQHQTQSHSNAIMGEAGVSSTQLLQPSTPARTLRPIANGNEDAGLYDAPDDCHFMPAAGLEQPEIALTCNLRTVNSEFDTTNFSVIPAEHTVGLHILCNDEIMAKSRLEPQSFAHLARLQQLSIQYCKLSRLGRHVLDGLQQLRNLTLRTHNVLWPALNFEIESDAFAVTRQLERLDLSANNIWSLPDNLFCALSALSALNMSENRLQDVNELGFRDRSKEQAAASTESSATTETTASGRRAGSACSLDLQLLDVSHNHFVLLPASGFGTLRRLRVLQAHHNEISMIADRALSGLKNLQVLDLSSNKIVALPSELFAEQAKSIQEVYLQNNSISVLSPQLFANLEQLQALDLSHNQVTSTWTDRNTFAGLIRLVLLNLAHNRLTQLQPEIFTDLYTLQILNLRHNQLENIAADTFAPMNNLHTLLLSHNRLKYLDAYALNGLYVLSLLSLDNNALIGVHPEAFRNCSALQDLNLNGNQLKTVPLALRNMRLLRTVDLGENMISVIEESAFKGLGNLYGLRLIGNYLENITMHAFRELPSLQILNLARNRIAVVEPGAFEMTASIQAIRLDGNELTDINGLFSNMPSLLWLNVSDNRLESFDYGHVPSTLQWLDLHKNRLALLSNRFGLDAEIRLQTLDVSFNQLQRIGPAAIPNSIELLFLNDNLISGVEPDTFVHKANLTRVDLYANQISTLDIKSLRLLGVAEHRPLPEFYIGGNPFTCDCNIDWLQKINQMGSRQYPRIMDLETIYCKLLNNRERAYIPLLEAEPKHFLCTYKTHCFAVCHCCEFDACDCEMTCPTNCTCFHDQTWSTNIVECSGAGYTQMPRRVPMDTTELYIDGNNFVELAGHSFLGRKNLAVLYANGSNVAHIHNTTFSGLKRLLVLHLEHNQLVALAGSEFHNLDSLRELYLQSNRIASIANGSFQPLRRLEVLRLDGNRLLHFEVWQLAANPYLVELSLADNQWSCECGYLARFRHYLAQSADKIVDAARVSCIYNNATSVLRERNGTKCTLRDGVAHYMHTSEMEGLLPLLLVATCAFVGFFGLIFGLFCYRHELKLWAHSSGCLLATLCYRSAPRFAAEQLDKERPNDAYFAYSLQDEHFVSQILAGTLESELGYRLCLHYRDVNINAYITDALLEAAESAKQVVLVLSKNFLYNEWTRFEYKSALHELVKRRKRIVFLLYGDLPQRDIDLDMRHYLRTSTCLEWDDKKFWQKLRLALPLPHGRVGNKSARNCRMYATAPEYQAGVPGVVGMPLAAAGARMGDKLYADSNNYATINECGGVGGGGGGGGGGRGYKPIPTSASAAAAACKFNTMNQLSKKQRELSVAGMAKTLEHQHHHHHNHNQQAPQRRSQHEYAVPAYPAYDSVDYAKQQQLQLQRGSNCECVGSAKRVAKLQPNGGLPSSFSSNFVPPVAAAGSGAYNCKKPCNCNADDELLCGCGGLESGTQSSATMNSSSTSSSNNSRQPELTHYESNLSLNELDD